MKKIEYEEKGNISKTEFYKEEQKLKEYLETIITKRSYYFGQIQTICNHNYVSVPFTDIYLNMQKRHSINDNTLCKSCTYSICSKCKIIQHNECGSCRGYGYG